MELNLTELIGFYAVLAGLGLVIGAAFMCSVIAGMFTAGGLLVLIGGTAIYVANAKAAQRALQAAGSTPMRSAA